MSVVEAGYRHMTKAITPGTPITLGESVLKWYDIAPPDEHVPSDIHVLARGNLRAAADSGVFDFDDDLGFVILHRCGESFYFLLVATWRNDNELWETVWAKNGATTSASGRGRSTGRTVRRSASGSSARSGTSSRRGAAFSGRRAILLLVTRTSGIRSRATSEVELTSGGAARSGATPRRRFSPVSRSK